MTYVTRRKMIWWWLESGGAEGIDPVAGIRQSLPNPGNRDPLNHFSFSSCKISGIPTTSKVGRT